MDIYEAIEKRRTIRIFKKEATGEKLRKIILAGSKAPSGGNRQTRVESQAPRSTRRDGRFGFV